MYKEIWNKIKYLNKSENNGSGKKMTQAQKIRFNSDNNLSLKKELEMHGVVITFFICMIYPQILLDECLYKLAEQIFQVLYDNRTDVSEGINVDKTSASKECIIYQYWYFLDKRFRL